MVPRTTSASAAAVSTGILPSTMKPLELPSSTTGSMNERNDAPSNRKDPSEKRRGSKRSSSSSNDASGSGRDDFRESQSDSTSASSEDSALNSSSSSASSSSRGPIIILEEVLRDLSQQIAELGPNHVSVAETWNTLGLIRLHMQRDVPAALQCHQTALQIYQFHTNNNSNSSSSASSSSTSSSICSVTPLQLAVTLNDLGKCLERNDQREEALEKYLEAQRLMRKANRSHKDIVASSIDRAIARLQRC